jgi:hypothetical protein
MRARPFVIRVTAYNPANADNDFSALEGTMFDQLQPEWGSNFSLRAAIRYAIAFGFLSGMTSFMLVLRIFRFHSDYMEIGGDLLSLVLSVALAVRFYLAAMSKARAQSSPTAN